MKQNHLLCQKVNPTIQNRDKMNFELGTQEFIELNKILKLLGLVETGGEAKIRIDQGEVKVNGEVEYRRRRKLRAGDFVEYYSETIEIQ